MPDSNDTVPAEGVNGGNKPASRAKSSSPRRSARSSSHQDPVIAPGFGTANDLKRLAKELSVGSSGTTFPVEAVQCMMDSRGRGIRSSRRNDDGTTTTTAAATAPISSAWAEFMKEEGVATTNDSAAPKVDEDVVMATSSTAESRVYNLDKLLPSWYAIKGANKKSKTERMGGVLVQAGTLDASAVGRKKVDATAAYSLVIPTSILPSVRIAQVCTAGHACHSLAVSTTGVVYGWGRNETQQLGSSGRLPTNVHQPMVLDDLAGQIVVSAAVGKSHTLVLLQSGVIYAAGLNKSGQCGIKSAALETVPNFRKAVFKGEDDDDKMILQVACGEDFSVALCDEGYMYTTGSSEFGQLANGETGEHFITANKIAFTNETAFTKRTTFCHAPTEKLYSNNDASTKVVPLSEDIRIQQVACGKHHTVALEADADGIFPRVFTWGCGDYGVLGHGIQANEFFPRCVGVLAHTRLPLTGSSHLAVAAGQHCSLLQCANGHVYYWGKHRPVGEATMRPTLVDVLANNGHVVTETSAGGQSVLCSTANGQTVAWGQCLHGGLGLSDKKSSAKPAFVPGLDSCRVLSLACGYGHSLFVIRDDDKEDKAAVKKIPVLDPSCTDDIADTAPPAGKGKPKKK